MPLRRRINELHIRIPGAAALWGGSQWGTGGGNGASSGEVYGPIGSVTDGSAVVSAIHVKVRQVTGKSLSDRVNKGQYEHGQVL